MPSLDRQRKVLLATALATALAVPAEGLRRVAYYDPPGVLTVCQGHTGADIIKGKVYSLKECDQFMTDDMRDAVATVERCAPGLPVNVLAAFSDAVFSIGPKIACNPQASTAARMLKAQDYAGACNQLLRWNKAVVLGVMVPLPGLTARRVTEQKVCLS